jgi:prepilin-type N-terminal cleavage/methylation domain-containing protein
MIRRGFSLMEMVVVISALSVAMALGAGLIVTAFKSQQTGAAIHDRIARGATLAAQFRADAHSAIRTPKVWKQYDAGKTCIIFEQKGDKAVVYDFRHGTLTRDDGETRRGILLPVKGAAIEFEIRDGLAYLRIVEPRPQGARPPIELAAALEGLPR